MLKQQHWKHWSNLCEEPGAWGVNISRLHELNAHSLIEDKFLQPQMPNSLSVECYEEWVDVDLEQGLDDKHMSYVSPETGRRKLIRVQDALMYQPDREQACRIIAQALEAQGTPSQWGESCNLYYVGDARINQRYSSVLLVSRIHQYRGQFEAILDKKIVRSPAVLFSTGSHKQSISWPSGWGVVLPLQDMFVNRDTGTFLDRSVLESEVRAPHRDLRREIVGFSLSEKILRIKGVGQFPVPAGSASAVIQRLVEEAWRGDLYVSLQELRDLVGMDAGAKFRDMMGGMKNTDQCIDATTVRGHYALRLIPIE